MFTVKVGQFLNKRCLLVIFIWTMMRKRRPQLGLGATELCKLTAEPTIWKFTPVIFLVAHVFSCVNQHTSYLITDHQNLSARSMLDVILYMYSSQITTPLYCILLNVMFCKCILVYCNLHAGYCKDLLNWFFVCTRCGKCWFFFVPRCYTHFSWGLPLLVQRPKYSLKTGWMPYWCPGSLSCHVMNFHGSDHMR